MYTTVQYIVNFRNFLQHGKNFHRILKFMQTKYRKKNDPVIPNLNKDQVCMVWDTLRFFPYDDPKDWLDVSETPPISFY